MKRVTIVNLGGRAHNIEVDAAEAIEAWLATAGTRLSGDPDRDELLLDFERAIGEKCDAMVSSDRDVVTAEQIASILESLGEVEPAEDTPTSSNSDEQKGANNSNGDDAQNTDSLFNRKLYRIDSEGMFTGVCAGVAAWLRIDVTVVRAIAVLCGIASGGTALLVYFALYLVLPNADSPEQRASAKGYGDTAQDLVRQARDAADPALRSVGNVLEKLAGVVSAFWKGITMFCVVVVLGAWIFFSAWVLVGGNDLMTPFNKGTSHWTAALLLTCLAWVALVPLIWLSGNLRRGVRRGGNVIGRALWMGTWVAALAGALVISASTSTAARGVLRDGQGRIQFGDKTVCFTNFGDASKPSKAEKCRKGDVIADLGDDHHGHHYLVPPKPTKPQEPAKPREPAEPKEPLNLQ